MAFKTTPEQDTIINYVGRCLVVKAFAGAGKTSTLVNYAKKNAREQLLYIAYNKAIKDEASRKFPGNVKCLTSHGMAYAQFGKNYKEKNKLVNSIYVRDIAKAIETFDFRFANKVLETVNCFLTSSSTEIMPGHIPQIPGLPTVLTEKEISYRKAIVNSAKLLWHKMRDLNDPTPISHDVYLKLYQLSQPDLSKKYSIILIDEAQDITPVVNSILLNQNCNLIYVGDPHQQIYRWRGAENAMAYKELDNAHKLNLTHSFRFGPKIAMTANAILNLKGENLNIIGRAEKDMVYSSINEFVDLDFDKQITILSRTVTGVILSAFSQSKKNKKIFWIGGINKYPLFLIEDIYWLSKEDYNKIKDKQLVADYPSFVEYKDFAEATANWEMIRNCKFVEDYGEEIPTLLNNLRNNNSCTIDTADVIVSTVHRSKGLEFETVIMSEDFPDVFAISDDTEKYHDELNLLYVAATRATKNLVINSMTEEILRDFISN